MPNGEQGDLKFPVGESLTAGSNPVTSTKFIADVCQMESREIQNFL